MLAETHQPVECRTQIVAAPMAAHDLNRVTAMATLDIGIPYRPGCTIGLFPETVRALLGHIAWLEQSKRKRESVDVEKYEVLARTIESIHSDAECLLNRARNEGIGKTSALNICSEIARKCRAIRHLYKDRLFSLSKIEVAGTP